jgi:hypothetical protein
VPIFNFERYKALSRRLRSLTQDQEAHLIDRQSEKAITEHKRLAETLSESTG